MRVLNHCTKRNQQKGELKAKLEYIKKAEKTSNQKYVYCYLCSKENTYEDMMLIKRLYKKYGGRQYLQFVFSFTEFDTAYNRVTPEQVMRLGIRFAKLFPNHQSCTCVHLDTKCIHFHCILNTVNVDTGRKIRMGPSDLYTLWHEVAEIYEEHNLPWDISDNRFHKWLAYTSQFKNTDADEFTPEELVCFGLIDAANEESNEDDTGGIYVYGDIDWYEDADDYYDDYDDDEELIKPIRYLD